MAKLRLARPSDEQPLVEPTTLEATALTALQRIGTLTRSPSRLRPDNCTSSQRYATCPRGAQSHTESEADGETPLLECSLFGRARVALAGAAFVATSTRREA